MLLGRRRIHPAPSKGLFPFLNASGSSFKDVEQDAVLHVAFASKKRIAGGGFTDYTARYGAMRDQDGRTLRDSLLESLANEPLAAPPTEFTPLESLTAYEDAIPKDQREEINRVAEKLHLVPQLDIPMIALSNGQQRRARILRQLIRHPKLLLLEDPFGEVSSTISPLASHQSSRSGRRTAAIALHFTGAVEFKTGPLCCARVEAPRSDARVDNARSRR